MDSFVVERDDRLIARIEDDHVVFEVSFDALEVTDVTLRFRRDGERGRTTSAKKPSISP